jgi:hypothetical protein
MTPEMQRKIEEARKFAYSIESNREYNEALDPDVANLGVAFQALDELVSQLRDLASRVPERMP